MTNDIDFAALPNPSGKLNAADILLQLGIAQPDQYADLCKFMGLADTTDLTDETLTTFLSFAPQHGITLDNIGAWKLDHNLAGGSRIGPNTAQAVYEAIKAPGVQADTTIRPINQAAINLIKSFEGLYLTTYKDVVGVPTIGYGHTGPDVHMYETITVLQAVQLLQADILTARKWVTEKVHVPLTDNQYGALCSLVYNVGQGAIIGTHEATDLANRDIAAAADDFLRFCYAGGKKIEGLYRRRVAERALFLTA